MADDLDKVLQRFEYLHGMKTVEIDNARLGIVPSGMNVVDLAPYVDEQRNEPRFIKGTAKAFTVQSLIDYTNRFKSPESVIFVDDSKEPSLISVLDFHKGPGLPAFCHHQVEYSFPISDQIKAWVGVSQLDMTHEQMATFIDDQQFDITNPPVDWMQLDRPVLDLVLHLLNIRDDIAADLDDWRKEPGRPPRSAMTERDRRGNAEPVDEELDEPDDRYIPRSAIYKLRKLRFGTAEEMISMAKTVELSVNQKAEAGYNPKTGERRITFTEEHETRAGQRRVIVPDLIMINVPIFQGEAPTLMPVRVQYKFRQGIMKWRLSLLKAPHAIRHAISVEAARAGEKTGLPVYYGAAPS